jgi:hypothetical protein
MLYVSSKNGSKYGITDTDDGVEEFLTAQELFKIVNTEQIEIDGVDIYESQIGLVKPAKETLSLIRNGKLHLAVSTMTMQGIWFGIAFRSKPRGRFVSNEVVNISRRSVNNYAIDKGNPKSYKGDLTLDDLLIYLEQYQGWSIEKCRMNGRL